MPYMLLALGYLIFCAVASWVDIWAGAIFLGMGVVLVLLIWYLVSSTHS